VAKKAIIAGASGLIGSNMLNILLQHAEYDEVLILVRKELPVNHPKLKQLIVDFAQLNSYSKLITGDALFCCLGSTKKKTPDLKEYLKIDHDYPVQLAQIAFQNNVAQYHLISAIGANASSSNFYTKMKGETERDIIAIGLPALYIYQPSILIGDRKESRPLEAIATIMMKIINPLLMGGLKKYRSIAAQSVANAMYKQSLKNTAGLHIYSSDIIQQLS
jgi:uncharacterized protein YbjT (DUF2867 family)